jgi:hypothetical protein
MKVNKDEDAMRCTELRRWSVAAALMVLLRLRLHLSHGHGMAEFATAST